jgi:hypothetical protein
MDGSLSHSDAGREVALAQAGHGARQPHFRGKGEALHPHQVSEIVLISGRVLNRHDTLAYARN